MAQTYSSNITGPHQTFPENLLHTKVVVKLVPLPDLDLECNLLTTPFPLGSYRYPQPFGIRPGLKSHPLRINSLLPGYPSPLGNYKDSSPTQNPFTSTVVVRSVTRDTTHRRQKKGQTVGDYTLLDLGGHSCDLVCY